MLRGGDFVCVSLCVCVTAINDGKKEHTYILDEREALVLVVVRMLLFSQVFVFGWLKTHGYHLCTGQHPAAFDGISTLIKKKTRSRPFRVLSILGEGRGSCPCRAVFGDDGVGPVISSLPSVCYPSARQRRQTPPTTRPTAASYKI